MAIAAVDISSGRKKIDDSTARLRCRPAAHTPRSRASGVCTAQHSTVSTALIRSESHTEESDSNRLQLSRPLKVGVPRPFQEVKDSTATSTSGSPANRAKKNTAGRT